MFDLSKHKQECKNQQRYVKKTEAVLVASESMQTIHGLNANGSTIPYSVSALEEDDEAIESFVDSLYNECSTNFRNDDICTAAELILSVSRECSKRLEEELLSFLCRMRLTSTDFKDHLN